MCPVQYTSEWCCEWHYIPTVYAKKDKSGHSHI